LLSAAEGIELSLKTTAFSRAFNYILVFTCTRKIYRLLNLLSHPAHCCALSVQPTTLAWFSTIFGALQY
jgi:hypothetical protein